MAGQLLPLPTSIAAPSLLSPPVAGPSLLSPPPVTLLFPPSSSHLHCCSLPPLPPPSPPLPPLPLRRRPYLLSPSVAAPTSSPPSVAAPSSSPHSVAAPSLLSPPPVTPQPPPFSPHPRDPASPSLLSPLHRRPLSPLPTQRETVIPPPSFHLHPRPISPLPHFSILPHHIDCILPISGIQHDSNFRVEVFLFVPMVWKNKRRAKKSNYTELWNLKRSL